MCQAIELTAIWLSCCAYCNAGQGAHDAGGRPVHGSVRWSHSVQPAGGAVKAEPGCLGQDQAGEIFVTFLPLRPPLM